VRSVGSHRGAWARRLILGTGLLAAAVLLLWGALVASFHLVPLPERLAAPGSPVVTWADGSTAHVSLAPDDRWRIPADLERVDPQYVQALLRLEDKRFHHHPGVDPLAIVRAAGLNLMRGRVVSGGSTLTMQLVRLVEPRPRTLVSKGIEAWRALQLEHFHTKDEILAAYLTFTPYGRNVEGLEAAALACFGHDARALSAAEVATLLAIPQAPSQRHPAPANAAALKAGRDKVAAFLAEQGVLPIGPGGQGSPEQVLAQVRATTVPPGLAAFPRDIPEVASWLRQRHPERTRIATTLERGTQRAVGIHLRRRHAALAHRGIHGGAAVVVETDTGRVVALVGSLDPWGDGEGDRIAMFDVARSPGSALKPFLYARAIDRGLALPEHLVRDVPVSFRGYAPRNYGGRYEGLVRLEDSLSRSLNLPFVFLLQEIGVEDALHTLRRGGVHSLVDAEGHYGLSLAAGGVEVTPLELTALYAALAADGQARPIRVTAPEAGPAPATPLFRPGAAWLTDRKSVV
jgi:penicillin-binding protein 1C